MEWATGFHHASWRRRMPLVAGFLLAALLGLAVVVVVTRRSADRGQAPAPAGLVVPGARGGGPIAPVSPGKGQRSGHRAAAAPAMSEGAPLLSARRAAIALWSFDWAHAPMGATPSLRPWVTAALWAELSDSPGAPAATAALVGERETARVLSVTVTVADRSPGGLGVAVSGEVVVRARGRPSSTGRQYAEMLLVPTASGWRVSELQS